MLGYVFNDYPDLLSVKEVKEALGIGKTLVYKLIQKGEIKSIRIGEVYRVPKIYLMDYILQKS